MIGDGSRHPGVGAGNQDNAAPGGGFALQESQERLAVGKACGVERGACRDPFTKKPAPQEHPGHEREQHQRAATHQSQRQFCRGPGPQHGAFQLDTKRDAGIVALMLHPPAQCLGAQFVQR